MKTCEAGSDKKSTEYSNTVRQSDQRVGNRRYGARNSNSCVCTISCNITTDGVTSKSLISSTTSGRYGKNGT